MMGSVREDKLAVVQKRTFMTAVGALMYALPKTEILKHYSVSVTFLCM